MLMRGEKLFRNVEGAEKGAAPFPSPLDLCALPIKKR